MNTTNKDYDEEIVKQYIPDGVYCYNGEKIEVSKDGSFRYIVKHCPFYTHVDAYEFGKCNLLDMNIFDEVKECGINEDYPELK